MVIGVSHRTSHWNVVLMARGVKVRKFVPVKYSLRRAPTDSTDHSMGFGESALVRERRLNSYIKDDAQIDFSFPTISLS